MVGSTVIEPFSGYQQIQTAPSSHEVSAYDGLHKAAIAGDISEIQRLVSAGDGVDVRDGHGRTPLMIAGYQRDLGAAQALIAAGADINALDGDQYDVLTIAAVIDDIDMVNLAIASGADTGLVTSPYQGTALIAASHLGHVDVVQALIDGGAPLDHVNNLAWTALIEAIVLGDGGPNHIAIVRSLIEAGADIDLADGRGTRPLSLARQRGYTTIAALLEAAGARP
ncbi:MAG: ankyrin repeat domain-containing protein [Alphaproteobacteria bacterium]|nr:ankyrin repeat domain-containing protein [Alphaproteobacteria bacterium]